MKTYRRFGGAYLHYQHEPSRHRNTPEDGHIQVLYFVYVLPCTVKSQASINFKQRSETNIPRHFVSKLQRCARLAVLKIQDCWPRYTGLAKYHIQRQDSEGFAVGST